MAQAIFEDNFEVLEKDPDGKYFDKVSRFKCHSDLYDMELMLDVNVSIYPLKVGDIIRLALASTINLDNVPTDGTYNAAMQSTRNTLMDSYEYVMYGRIFKYTDAGGSSDQVRGELLSLLMLCQTKVKVYISYGGLLMLLTGDLHKLKDLEVDSTVYLLIRKV